MIIRKANIADLPIIVELLASDKLGKGRERQSETVLAPNRSAFDAINNDPAHKLVVIVEAEQVVGTLQLSFIPYLTYNRQTEAGSIEVLQKSGICCLL